MTRKLMLWLTGATILFWIAASGFGAYVMRDEYDEIFDSTLQETAQRLMPLVVDDLFQRDETDQTPRVDGSLGEAQEYLTYQVRDQSGTVLLHSHDAQPQAFDAPLKRGFFDTPSQRIYTEEAVSGTLFLQVADRLSNRSEAMQEGLLSLLLPIIFLIPLSMATIWYLVRRSLAPLGAVRREIGARDGSNLKPMEIEGLPAELESITGSVNRLLDRLRTALEAERSFASNSAHELRTPIAGALAQTQRLIAELPAGQGLARARTIEASLHALSHLSEKLLQLARAESGIGGSRAAVDIASVVRLVVEEFERMPANAGRLRLDIAHIQDGPLRRSVDVDALGIILRNLVENALLHGSKEEPVRIGIAPDAVLTVTNGCPVVAAGQLQELTRRFTRGVSTGTGSGLGLAIADTLARQMGATLALASPADGQADGFQATLRIGDR